MIIIILVLFHSSLIFLLLVLKQNINLNEFYLHTNEIEEISSF